MILSLTLHAKNHKIATNTYYCYTSGLNMQYAYLLNTLN